MRMEAEHPLAALPWVGKRRGRACLLRQLLSVTITPKPHLPHLHMTNQSQRVNKDYAQRAYLHAAC